MVIHFTEKADKELVFNVRSELIEEFDAQQDIMHSLGGLQATHYRVFWYRLAVIALTMVSIVLLSCLQHINVATLTAELAFTGVSCICIWLSFALC